MILKPFRNVQFFSCIVLFGFGLYKFNENIQGTVNHLRKSVTDLVTSHGYPIQEHYLTTSDGYILCIHRIPHGKNNKVIHSRPILLGHGSSMGSTGFLIGDPEDSLGYVLADNGYDVWLINNRGNSFSKNSTVHNNITSRSQEFWDFGFEEMTLIDYPEVIDYILKRTGKKSLFFLGISQGSSQYLGLLSDLPAYNSKIKAGVLLAPALYVNGSSAFAFRYANAGILYKYASEKIFGHYEAWLAKDFLLWGAHTFCSPGSILYSYCPYFGSIIYGETTFDYDILTDIADLIFQGSSLRPYHHFAQWHKSGLFQKYDFGSRESNNDKYGVPVPPIYDLSKVKAKTLFILGGRDEIVTLGDALRLMEDLKEAPTFKKILFDYSHTDFVASVHSKDRLFPFILEYLRKIP